MGGGVSLRQRAATGCALLLLLAGAAAQSSPSVSVAGDRERISIIAEDVSLRQAIDCLARQQGLAVIAYSPLQQVVSLQASEQPLQEVLRALLQDHSFTLMLDDAGGRLWIYAREHGGTEARAEPMRLGRGGDSDGGAAHYDRLSAWGSTDSFPALVDVLEHGQALARAEAAVTLADRHPGQALPSLTALLEDPDDHVVTVALEGLADIGSEAAVAELGRLLQSADAATRIRVIDLLADVDGAPATRLLEQAVADPDPRVQALAGQYLAERRPVVRTVTR